MPRDLSFPAELGEVENLMAYHALAETFFLCRVLKFSQVEAIFARANLFGGQGADILRRVRALFHVHWQTTWYHDWYHTCCVITGCADALRWIFSKPMDSLNADEARQANSLLMAAVFHDLAHAGVGVPDSTNVSRSMEMASAFIENHDVYSVCRDLVLDCIECTAYPFVRDPVNELQATLRDSDLLQILEPTWFEDIYCHMYAEFRVCSPDLAFRTFCENESSFLRSAKFFSRWWVGAKQHEFQRVAIPRTEAVLGRLEERAHNPLPLT